MGIVSELCAREGVLDAAQTERMESLCGIIELISDIAYSQVTVFIQSKQPQSLVVIAQASPTTTYIQYKPNLRGTVVHATEEPLIWRTMQQGQAISGNREWALGMFSVMQTYPIWDINNKIVGAVSFESGGEGTTAEGHEIFLSTANYLIENFPIISPGRLYRRASPRDGLMVIDDSGKILCANAEANSMYNMLGVGRIVGRRISDRQISLRIVQKVWYANQPLEIETELSNLVFLQRAIPIVKENRTFRTILIITDITEVKKKEKELLIKSAVIQEIHHRVKNNLQTIASLLRLQARRTTSEEVKAALQESVNRILSISVVHEFLSQHDEELIDVAGVAKNILDLVVQNMLEPNFDLTIEFEGNDMILPSEKATSLALVVNELIQNSIEHAFVGQVQGTIGIRLWSDKSYYCIEIYDDGNGLPDDFMLKDSKSLGLQIVRTLIETDLGGEIKLVSNNGVHVFIKISRSSGGGL